VEDKKTEYQKRQRKKRDRMVEQKKKLEVKQLKRRLKKAKKGERKIILEKLERIENRKRKVEEETFDIMVKTLNNAQKNQKRRMEERRQEREVRDELVERGLMEDEIKMNSKKYRLDGDELQNYLISKEERGTNSKPRRCPRTSDKWGG
jgi:hypothetical protein